MCTRRKLTFALLIAINLLGYGFLATVTIYRYRDAMRVIHHRALEAVCQNLLHPALRAVIKSLMASYPPQKGRILSKWPISVAVMWYKYRAFYRTQSFSG